MALSTLLWAVTASFCFGSSMAQSISQAQTAASGQEGGSVTLPCNYSTSYSAYYLYWYKQPPTGGMTYLIRQGSSIQKNSVTGRFSVNFRKKIMSINLTITALQLGDSAVYFCALSEAHSDRTSSRSCTQTSEP
uniref:Ig-like domain-containing protein n=1 Tax=Ornithorhynchus anatinus TaxID=9258 RepID=A0A6I8NDB4_ORNAN